MRTLLLGSFVALSCFGANFSQPRVLGFEDHHGQYVTHAPGYSFSVTAHAATLTIGGNAVRMSVAGASPKLSLEALNRMPGNANYLLGRAVRASYDLYSRVRWRAVYPGIDLLFRGNQQHLEYDFDIAAGRDPSRIKLAFEGIDGIRIDQSGELVLRAGSVEIHQPKPVAYQLIAGQEQPVDVSYRMDTSNHVRFRTGAYDRRRPLVIDPEIVFEKFFGGSGGAGVSGMVRDTQGNLYVAGSTNSTDFPTVNPFQSHLGTAPLLVTANAGKTWSYPSVGPSTSISAIAAAPSAPLIVYAATPRGIFASADGGTTWTATAGTGLVGSPITLAGSTATLAVDASSSTTLYTATAQGFFVSTDGAASWQASKFPNFSGELIVAIVAHPTQAGTVFVSFGADGLIPNTLLRSTDFGRTWTQLTVVAPPNQLEAPILAILFGSNGTLILGTPSGLLISTDGGKTFSAGANQQVDNAQELAISPSNPSILYAVNVSGVLRSSDGGQTFTPVLSSVNFTEFSRIAVDPRNPSTVYAADYDLLYQSTNAGQTWSQLSLPYPISPQLLNVSPADSRVFLGATTQNTVFITKWSADGSQVLYSTYLGGSGVDTANAIAVDASGSAYVTGLTSSPDFPTTSGAFQTKLTSSQDIFVSKLSADGSQLVYSTLLGSQSSVAQAIAVDDTGNAVITGFANGNFPVTPGAFQTTPSTATCDNAPPFSYGADSGNAFVSRIASGGNALVYSTLLGGTCGSYGTGIALDASGNAWVTGGTTALNFPVTADALQSTLGGGYYDGFLARFSPSGELGYSTYIGGSGYDTLNAIAFDSSGSIYLTGESGGLSQPASPGAFQSQVSATCYVFSMGPAVFSAEGNAIVLKLDPKAHSIQGLTYLGAPYCLSPSSIAVDSSGEPWVSGNLNPAGSAPQTVGPFEIGLGEAFISKFSADFTQLLFSTYFMNFVSSLALDSSGFAYVAGAGPFNPTTELQQAYIARIDPTPAAISLDSIVSPDPVANPSVSRGIAGGEVIHILGKNMGPAASTPGVINSGFLATSVAGVQVTFDGTAVPLLSVSAQEIDLVTPFELNNKSVTTMQVQYNGVPSNPVQVGVNGADVQILGVYNEDFSVNSASNPAQAGSIMSLYVAGAGQIIPPGQDGQVNGLPLPVAAIPVQLEWSGNNVNPTVLPVTFAGAAPGLAAGILQVNFVAPQQSLMTVNLVLGNTNVQYNTTQFNVAVKP
jgi:uncharacterized protein (TIGR03437 family)